MAVVTQENDISFDFYVMEMMIGRYAYRSAFARKSRLIILDEPTNHLDIGYQFLILDVGLKPSYYHRKLFHLSGGECQRAAIARALISSPKLIICDESTSALDVSVQAQIIELLKRLQKEKKITYLFITHDLLLARNICNRIAVMYKGSVVEMGTAEEILDAPKHPYTQLLSKCVLKPHVDENFQFVSCESVRKPAENGCKFYEYCPNAMEKCRNCKPNLESVDGQSIACFNVRKLSVREQKWHSGEEYNNPELFTEQYLN